MIDEAERGERIDRASKTQKVKHLIVVASEHRGLTNLADLLLHN